MRPTPEGLQASFAKMAEDSTVYLTMSVSSSTPLTLLFQNLIVSKQLIIFSCRNGPSEFFITGTLKTWSIIPDLPLITTPTLLLNGRHDEVQDLAVRPIFEGIGAKVRWVTFEESSHTPYVEEGERYGEVVAGFLGYA